MKYKNVKIILSAVVIMNISFLICDAIALVLLTESSKHMPDVASTIGMIIMVIISFTIGHIAIVFVLGIFLEVWWFFGSIWEEKIDVKIKHSKKELQVEQAEQVEQVRQVEQVEQAEQL